jgi:hypothetical protein
MGKKDAAKKNRYTRPKPGNKPFGATEPIRKRRRHRVEESRQMTFQRTLDPLISRFGQLPAGACSPEGLNAVVHSKSGRIAP